MFTSLLAASAFASQAAAFLVPLEVAKAVKSVQDDLHLTFLEQKATTFALECPGCYFDTANDRQDDYAAQPENRLALNFTIDDRDNSLALNGRKFYPLEFPSPPDLYAPLVRSSNGIESPPIHLGFALEYLPFQDASEGTIAPIRLTIVDLDSVQVKVPTVTIDVIKLPSQELLIGKIDTIPFAESPGSECETTFCRVKAIAMARLREMIEATRHRAQSAGKKLGWKSCGAHKAGALHHGDDKSEPQFANGRLPTHRRPPPFHHHSHRHHHRHGFSKFLHQAVHLFVIPAMLGVIGGLTASAIGMFVGQLIVFIWFRFVRGGQRGNASARNEAALEEEKESLVEENDELPPAYTDSEEAILTDEKN